MNAVRNGDLHKAVDVLQAIHDECVPGAASAERLAARGRRAGDSQGPGPDDSGDLHRPGGTLMKLDGA
jgi:hypothetical protein